jgi:hypothetical protein
MGNANKKKEIIRKEPLRTLAEISKNEEAREKILANVLNFFPGFSI